MRSTGQLLHVCKQNHTQSYPRISSIYHVCLLLRHAGFLVTYVHSALAYFFTILVLAIMSPQDVRSNVLVII